ncbi:MAG: hypothetical protein ACRDRK_26465 [Pseudonocardia sp.]
MDPDVLDSLYVEMRRCRVHCTGRAASITGPRGNTTATSDVGRADAAHCPRRRSGQIHFVLSGAYKNGGAPALVATDPLPLVKAPPARAPPSLRRVTGSAGVVPEFSLPQDAACAPLAAAAEFRAVGVR